MTENDGMGQERMFMGSRSEAFKREWTGEAALLSLGKGRGR